MVYYRKYRPQTIADLDSKVLRDELYAFVGSGDIPQAFLFTGPKGLGKTSTARILAKVVNCEKRNQESKKKSKTSNLNPETSGLEPCNTCTQCVSITNGNNIDVLEIDGASNRGIDEIRDLREKIKLSPVAATKKVYIIDEVHMLTTEAFNALLKTLEEPPPHAMFIFCTTEPHKVPATIVSRCFHVQLDKATDEDLVHAFSRIAEGEKLTITDEAYTSIAKLSDGSFRDGTKILEEIVLKNNGATIDAEIVEQLYKTKSIDQAIADLSHALVKKDAAKGLDVVAGVVAWGVDMRFFLEQLLLYLDNDLLQLVGVRPATKGQRPATFTLEDIRSIVPLLLKAYEDTKFTPVAQLPLELAIIEATTSQLPITNYELPVKEEKPEKIISEPKPSPSRPVQAEADDQRPATNFDWSAFIRQVNAKNQIVAGLLRSCSLKSIDGNGMVIETAYQFHKDKLDTAETLALIGSVYEQMSGQKVQVSVLLKS